MCVRIQYKKHNTRNLSSIPKNMGPSLETSLIVIPCNTFHILSSKTMSNTMAKRVHKKNKLRSSWMVLVTLNPLSEVAIIKGTEGVAHPVHKEVQDVIVQGVNRILRAMLGDHIFGRMRSNVVQCRQYWSKRSKMVGPNWSKKLVSQHCSKKSATFFGTPCRHIQGAHEERSQCTKGARNVAISSVWTSQSYRKLWIGRFFKALGRVQCKKKCCPPPQDS